MAKTLQTVFSPITEISKLGKLLIFKKFVSKEKDLQLAWSRK